MTTRATEDIQPQGTQSTHRSTFADVTTDWAKVT